MSNWDITGMRLIQRERRRQIEVEGYTPEHDAGLRPYSLVLAARCYEAGSPSPGWPWDPADLKIRDPLSNLIRAGALYLAAFDRYESWVDKNVSKRQAQQIAATIDALLAKAREVLS